MRPTAALILAAALVASGCTKSPTPPLTAQQLEKIPLYAMTPQQVDRYIAHVHATVPELRRRIALIGRQNIGQPYVLNLLGEFPYQVHDTLPMFSLTHSDCVVFAEHTYAMALSRNWEEFFWMLQRIRYKDGVVGVATRNHYTEQDWNVNNAWLVKDISAELAGPHVASYQLKVDRARFLRTRHNTRADLPVTTSTERYVPAERVHEVLGRLADGDFVNVISTRNGEYWASHVGLVVTAPDGSRQFLNSAEPKVREESFAAFIARTAERAARQAKQGKPVQRLAGFKFLRLNEPVVVPPALPQPRP
ncbi:N-acetylmuramoyl-L-alanine amidase-like domain-containing protein [Massilia sp. METH4]|uniref:N-acetylmuramoyl-L-alanine amidase-like domain-containing protein n=1 Tax=Massilia sp. METH4 TaxID=3123041 RepID=UPI0030CD60D8